MTEAIKKQGSLASKIIKILAYILIMLILAELFYRFFWTEPPMTEVIYGNHPVFHHVPKAFLKSGLGEYDFRGTKYKLEKEADTIRIAFIGDSFTYGFTPWDETIPHHLKSFINLEFPDTKVEVLNFGFVSYSPIIEEVVYRRLIAKLKPDYVIQLYDTFDPQDDVLYLKSATFDENGVPLKVAGEEFLKVGIRRSALVRFFQFAYEVLKNDWHYLPIDQRFESRIRFISEPETLDWAIKYSLSIINRTARKVEQDGAVFMMFQYPPPHIMRDLSEFQQFLSIWGIGPGWDAPQKSQFTPIVLEYCKANKMNCYDFGSDVREMENDLGEHGSRLKIYNNKDGHFTGFANKRFAKFILSELVNKGFAGQGDK